MNAAVRVLSGLVAIGLCGAGMWLTSIQPELKDRLQKPIASTGHAGEVVHNRIFSARIDKVDVANGVVKSLGLNKKVQRSPGVFVVVYVSVKSEREPIRLGHARLTTRDGLTYKDASGSSIFSGTDENPPMLWKKTWFMFELPTDQLAGAHAVIGQADLINNLSAEVDIDLRLDDRTAARKLATAPAEYRLPAS